MKKSSSTKTRRRKTTVGATPKRTRTFGGKKYSHKSCHTTKTAAKKAAESHRTKKKSAGARVVKIGGKHCVYTRG